MAKKPEGPIDWTQTPATGSVEPVEPDNVGDAK